MEHEKTNQEMMKAAFEKAGHEEKPAMGRIRKFSVGNSLERHYFVVTGKMFRYLGCTRANMTDSCFPHHKYAVNVPETPLAIVAEEGADRYVQRVFREAAKILTEASDAGIIHAVSYFYPDGPGTHLQLCDVTADTPPGRYYSLIDR